VQTKKLTAALLLLAVTSSHTARAEQAADESNLRQAVADYVAAFNRGDAKALAELWSPEADKR
jgi:predicted lipid-binding transport protein (Tim44 family)